MSLTLEGVAVFDLLWPQAQKLIGGITNQLNPADFADLKRLLDLINDAAQHLHTADTTDEVKKSAA